MWNEYAIDPRARINLGIRRRLAPLVDNSRRRIELLTSLLLSLHGTPVIYYGDEIGMGDNLYLGDRNGVRTPMQWNGDRNAGFSQYVELDLSRFAGRTPVELIGRVHFPRIGELPYLLTLGPHDFLWFELT